MHQQSRIFRGSDIARLEKRERVNLITTVAGFKSVNLIGTADPTGQFNLAIFNSVLHVGSNPPLLGMIVRPTHVERHTFENIMSSRFYTINQVHAEMIDAAHQTSAKYPRGESEFELTGLTPQLKDDFPAPFVSQSKVKIGMALREHLNVNTNGTHFLIGEIIHLEIPTVAQREDGSLDLSKVDTLAMNGLDSYYRTVEFRRKGYART